MVERSLAGALVAMAFAIAMPAWGQGYKQLQGQCFEGANPDEKIQACTSIIKANKEAAPTMASAYFNRGLEERRLGDNESALRDYAQALRLQPSYVAVYNARCFLFAIANRLQEALKDCNEALHLDPWNQYAYDSRGFTYLKLGKLDAAISDYNAALRIQPNRPYSMFGLGVARKRKGDVAGGNTDMDAAKKQIPGIADEFAHYGVQP
jgi:tetratricopeptide (TPR) repeat protein